MCTRRSGFVLVTFIVSLFCKVDFDEAAPALGLAPSAKLPGVHELGPRPAAPGAAPSPAVAGRLDESQVRRGAAP